MRNIKRTALAGVAVFVLCVAGCTPASGQPPASAAPSVEPSAPEPSQPATAGSSPGTTTWQWREHQILTSLPDGWASESFGSRIKADQGGDIAIEMTGPVTHVYSDACRSEGKLDAVGSTAGEVVAALDAQISTDATITRPTLNGRPWTRVDLVQGPAVDRTTCRYGADGPLQVWANAAENDYYAFAPGTAGSVLMTDVDGDLVVVITAIGDTASATDRAALESIIASMKIDPA